VTELPIALAVAHNWLAAVLLLNLLWIIAGIRPRPDPL
jgi:heme A synthase